jgi:hypothetical protein
LNGYKYTKHYQILIIKKKTVGRMPFFFPLTGAGTSNSCTADKENSRKAKAQTMYVPHSARPHVGVDLPTFYFLG